MKKTILITAGIIAFAVALTLLIIFVPQNSKPGPVDNLPEDAPYTSIDVVPTAVGEAVVIKLDNPEDVARIAEKIVIDYLPIPCMANIEISELDFDRSEDPYARHAEKVNVSEELENIEKFGEVMHYSPIGLKYSVAFKQDVKYNVISDVENSSVRIEFEKTGIYEEKTVYTVRTTSKSFEAVHLDTLALLSATDNTLLTAYDENFEYYVLFGAYDDMDQARIFVNTIGETTGNNYIIEPVSTGNRGKTMK